jgi:hypothetical protein
MSYRIIKQMQTKAGQRLNVLMNDGYGEILVIEDEDKAMEFISVLNSNTDSGCKYSILAVPK